MKLLKRDGLVVLTIISLFFLGCEMNKMDNTPRTITLNSRIEGVPVRLELVKGENYSARMVAGPLAFNLLPQTVIWVEDSSGRLVDTVYVSGADYKKMRHGGKGRLGVKFYEESFPLWSVRMKAAGKGLPSPKNPYPDSITSATPMSSFTLMTKLPATGPFTIMLEINKSGDTNAAFTVKNNGWVGQPSLVYKASITDTKKGSVYEMKLVGHSGRLSDPAGIYPDLSLFGSALKQVEKISIIFE
jgi:hypothetical protein